MQIEHADGHIEERAALPVEAQVLELVHAALSLPLSARLAWFDHIAKAMLSANQSLGWNGHLN